MTGMSLSDAERLAIIDQSYKRLLGTTATLVQYYTDKNISVSYLRAKRKRTPTGWWLSTARRTTVTGEAGNIIMLRT